MPGLLENPFLGYLVLLLFMLLIQCSDVTIGILQAIAISMPFSFGMVIPILLLMKPFGLINLMRKIMFQKPRLMRGFIYSQSRVLPI